MLLKSIGYINTIKVGIRSAKGEHRKPRNKGKTMKLSKSILAVAAAGLMSLGLLTENAYGIPMATYSVNGGAPVSVAPNLTGMFSVNTLVGNINLFLNGSVAPFFDLNGGAITATGPGTVTLSLSNDFTNLSSITTAIGGTGEA